MTVHAATVHPKPWPQGELSQGELSHRAAQELDGTRMQGDASREQNNLEIAGLSQRLAVLSSEHAGLEQTHAGEMEAAIALRTEQVRQFTL